MLAPEKQLEIIKRGAVEIISEEELLKKLERSCKETVSFRKVSVVALYSPLNSYCLQPSLSD